MKVNRPIWNMCRILNISNATFKELEQDYERLTNLVLAYGGKIHGSQHDSGYGDGGFWDTIVVYFEVPKDSLDEFVKEENEQHEL